MKGLHRKVDYTIKINRYLSSCLPEHSTHYLPIHERVSASLILMLVLCVSVCLLQDLGNGRLYRCTSYAGLKRFSWPVAQTAFQAYTMHGLRGVFGTFQQVTHWSPCTHVTLPSYTGQDESCPPLERCRNILERHGYHSSYCFYQKKSTCS